MGGGIFSSTFISGPDLGGVPRILGLGGVSLRPHPSEGVQEQHHIMVISPCGIVIKDRIVATV